MDSKYRRNGRLIDIVDEEWRAERLPHEDIQVPLEELPDPEADSADSHLTLREQSMRWQENFPEPASTYQKSFVEHRRPQLSRLVLSRREHINVRDQLPKYLNGQVKLLTTRCIIIETEKIAKKTHGALTILKQFGIHECGHKEPVTGSHCIKSMIGNKNEKHYILATQDRDLQEKMRTKAGVPLLYLHNKSPTLEKPSKASYNKAGQALESNFTFISETQNEALKNMKKALGVEEKVEEPKLVLKKKKPHNPNPLSCKKKKNKQGNKNNNDKFERGVKEGKVRKRKKVRKPKMELSQATVQ